MAKLRTWQKKINRIINCLKIDRLFQINQYYNNNNHNNRHQLIEKILRIIRMKINKNYNK